MTDHDALVALATEQVGLYSKTGAQGKAWGAFYAALQAPVPVPVPVPSTALFPNAAWLNNKLPTAPRIDASSAQIVAALNGQGNRVLIASEFATPIYRVDGFGPLKSVVVDTEPSWGLYRLSVWAVPIPAGAAPNPGSDGKLVVVDGALVYDMAHFEWVGGVPHCAYGGIYSRGGSARGLPANYYPTVRNVNDALTPITADWGTTRIDRGTGSGICSAAGCITNDEVRAGLIPHTLTAATSLVVGSPDRPNSQDYRYPASASDHGGGIVWEGMRVYLPITDAELAAIANPAQRMVARALRDYGLVFTDGGGALVAINRELPKAGEVDPWPALGADMGWFGLDQIPWGKLKVLARWDGR